jgi:choline kinase
MGKLIEKKDIVSDNIRELAFEVILSLVTKYPKLINDTEKVKILLELIFKYALEMDDDIPNDWLNPKSDSLINEDVIPEEKLNTALIIVERLLESADNEDQLLALTADIIMMLIKNDSNWKYKYIGFISISHIVEYINDMKGIAHIFPEIFANLTNANPKIRFACLECINNLSDQFSPDFQNDNYANVIGGALQLLKDPSLRVRMEACFTLESFFTYVNDQVAFQYCETILNEIFAIFLQDEVQVCLIDSLVNLTREIVRALDDKFEPYSDKCMEIFCNFLFKIYKMKVKKSLFGPLLIVITTIGPICKETFEKFLPSLIDISIDLQNSVENCEDPILKSLEESWEPMIPIINEKYPNLIPQIIESSLKLITKTPKISLSSNPETKFDLGDLLSDETGKTDSDEAKKVNVNTVETNELTDSIELINVFIEGFDKHYVPYIEFTEQTIIPLKNYEISSTVRGSAINVLDTLANLVKKHSSVEVFHAKVKHYTSVIFETLEKEQEYDNVIIMLETLDNIFDCAAVFLGTAEINVMFSKLIEIFNKIEKSRIDLIQHKEKQEQVLESEKAAALGSTADEEEENDFEDEEENLDELECDIDTLEKVLTGFSNVMGTIFKHHKELCMEVVSKLLIEYLPKYFKDEASTFEKKLGFFILDDMIEFLGQELLFNVWSDIFEILVKYANHNACAIRQAVLYGLGEFAKYTKKDFENYYINMMNALLSSLEVKKSDTDGKDEFLSAKDNAVSSIGKIIKYQSKSINLKETVSKWLHLLPIEVDKVEAFDQYELLCDIINNSPDLIVGENNSNLVKIICLLGKIYKTTFTNEKINENVAVIMGNFKQNPALHVFVEEALRVADDKVKDKISAFFK